ncbi:MAG: site-specific integrase [Lachnospiraceae bacterium]|nr:site-specific integrase [Lachnospiraceae bacterium]
MKNPKGYGTIVKLTGNRRRPWEIRKTNTHFYDSQKKCYVKKQVALGYYATKEEAMLALARYNEVNYDLDLGNLTFDNIWQRVKRELKVSKSRTSSYNSSYKHLGAIKDKKIREIKTLHLKNLFSDPNISPYAKSDMKIICNKVFNYALQNDLVTKNYTQFIKLDKIRTKRVKTVFTGEEVARLWEHAEDDWAAAFMLLLLYSGMRSKELIDLRYEEVDLDKGTINIEEAKNQSSIRYIPIHKRTLPLFKEFLLRSAPGKQAIIKPNGNPVYYKNMINRELPRLVEYMGAKHTLHECRHSFITRAYQCNVDLLKIQRLVGHKPDTITFQVYTHLTMDELREAINTIDY